MTSINLRPECLIGEALHGGRIIIMPPLKAGQLHPRRGSRLRAQATVYLGPARSGKTSELLRHYVAALRSGPLPPGRALWLAPTGRAVAQVRSQLLHDALEACLAPGVMTFGIISRRILVDSRSRLRPISPVVERELLRRCVRACLENGDLEFYAQAATRDSFVDLAAEHFRELSRRGVDAPRYARVRNGKDDAGGQRELARLYEQYQQRLTAHALVDSEGTIWAACHALRNEAGTWPRELALVVADGFSDFTAGQRELLCILAQRAKQLLISLPIDVSRGLSPFAQSSEQRGTVPFSHTDPAPRRDLFAKSIATLAALRKSFPKLAEQHFAPLPTSWPALDHIRRHVFQPPSRVPATSSDVIESLDRLRFVEAAGAHDEIVQIAQRIKRLLTISLPHRESCREPGRAGQGEGSVRPGDVLIIFRSLGEAAPRIREVFGQFGIPYFLEAGRPLATSPVVRTLAALIQLHEQDWPFRRIVAVITNNMLSAIDEDARRAADWIVRDLQVAEGRAALLDRTRQLAAIDAPPAELSDHVRRRIVEARAALPALEKLCAALDELPARATASEWSAALARLGATLGIPSFIDEARAPRATNARTGRVARKGPAEISDESLEENVEPDLAADTNRLAWQLLSESLSSLERLDAWLGEPPRKLARHELVTHLADLARNESLPPGHDEVGRVRVLSAATARTIRARHVFLAGMSEQAFPAPERAGRLASEADYRRLVRASSKPDRAGGKRASSSSPALEPTRSQEEMLLFYEVLSSAEDSLTISYAAMDERGQTLPSSPYVAEIRRTFDAPARKALLVAPPQLSPIRSREPPWSRAEWRISAVAKALAKEPDLLAGLFMDERSRPIGAAIDAGLGIVHARARRESFGPAEGILEGAARKFAERFGPKHLWSPSQWETYAACPYKFFLQNVLGLEPLGDLVLETDFARRGSRLHQVLAAFHRQWRDECPQHSPGEDEAARFSDYLQRVIDERIIGAPAGSLDAALVELDRRQIRKWAAAHFDHHVTYHGDCSRMGGAMTPDRFEFRFGSRRAGDADSDPDSSEDAFILEVGGEQIRITGQIDRIDVGTVGGRTVFNVIDYKSGKKFPLKPEHIESGDRLQLPIYVEAAQMLVFGGDAMPLAAGYWSMASGFDSKGALAAKKGADSQQHWADLRAAVRRAVGRFVADIRGGNFPVHSRDEQCTSLCEFNTICRIAQVRSLRKTWPPETDTRHPTPDA